MVGYYADPAKGFALATKGLVREEELHTALKESNTTYDAPLINETVVAAAVMSGVYSYVIYKLIQSMNNPNSFKAKQKKKPDEEANSKTFSDIGGCQKAKEAITEIIEYIKHPEVFINAGVRMPKGVLLYGPPGTGKTLIAKAAAAEAGIPVIYTSGSEFVEVFVGLGAKRIREIFKQAREQSPCMIFIDEIDAVGYSRGNNNFIQGGGHRELETTLNQLLNEMDGFEENDRIIVVAATNLATTLDPALLRPGRFDRKVEVTLPAPSDRKEIFKIHLKNKIHSITDQQLAVAALQTDGLAGAEIENIVNLAALNSVRKARTLKQE
jgi:cell division protease FtsH